MRAGQAPGMALPLVRMFRREPNMPRSTGSPLVPPLRMAEAGNGLQVVGAVAGRQRLARRLGIGDEGQRRIGRDGGDDHRIHVEGGRLLGAGGGKDGGQGRGQRQGAGKFETRVLHDGASLSLHVGRPRACRRRARGSWTGNAAQGGERQAEGTAAGKARGRARIVRSGQGRDRRGARPSGGPAASSGGRDSGAGGATEATAAAGKAGR